MNSHQIDFGLFAKQNIAKIIKMIFESHKLFTRLREFETESCLLNARAITELTESNLLLRLTLEGPASA